ncbi:glycosyltransferase family protein [soil metagenome]
MSGEGRGHATRVRAIVDALRDRHEIAIFAPGDAYELLAPAYANSEVRVEQIPGLRFFYTPKNRLDFLKTGAMAARYSLRFRSLLKRLTARLREGKPDLIITDFEPSLPRAAKRCGIPFISLNHQHFLIVNDLSALPRDLRRHAAYMALVVRSYYSGMARTIVSSFYFPPLKPQFKHVTQVGVILRPSVANAVRSRRGHYVAYLRKFAPDTVLTALKSLGAPVYVYGLGERASDENLSFKKISEENFVNDLASCEALISTAGNQLVGEALFLGKPVLAMPEHGNHEQFINAFFLREEETGDWLPLEKLDAAALASFISKLPDFRQRIVPEKYNGTPLALDAIEQFLLDHSSGAGRKE